MLKYEDTRTKEIVSNLVKLGNTARTVVLIGWIIFMTVLGTLLGRVIELWWLGFILGASFGFMVGAVSAAFYSLMLEWMAQMLIAQGEILAATVKKEGD